MTKSMIAFGLLAAVLLVGVSQRPPDPTEKTGFQSIQYQQMRAQLLARFPDTAQLQFCVNGAAFILADQGNWATQYMGAHGDCVRQLVTRFKQK